MNAKSMFEKLFVCLCVMFLLAGCSGGGGGSSESDSSNNGTATALDKTVTGGEDVTLEVTDKSSPIYGTKIDIPADAIESGKQERITITYSDDNHSSLLKDGKVVSKSIILEKSGEGEFLAPVTVTIPSTENINEEDVLSVYYWDEIYDSSYYRTKNHFKLHN